MSSADQDDFELVADPETETRSKSETKQKAKRGNKTKASAIAAADAGVESKAKMDVDVDGGDHDDETDKDKNEVKMEEEEEEEEDKKRECEIVNVITFIIDRSSSTISNKFKGELRRPVTFEGRVLTFEEEHAISQDRKLSPARRRAFMEYLKAKKKSKREGDLKDPTRKQVIDEFVHRFISNKKFKQADRTTVQCIWYGQKTKHALTARLGRHCRKCGRYEYPDGDEKDQPLEWKMVKSPTPWEPDRTVSEASCVNCGTSIRDFVRHKTLDEKPLERSLATCDAKEGLVEIFWQRTNDPELAKEVEENGTLFGPAMAHAAELISQTGTEFLAAPAEVCEQWKPKPETEMRALQEKIEKAAAQAKAKASQKTIDLMELGGDDDEDGDEDDGDGKTQVHVDLPFQQSHHPVVVAAPVALKKEDTHNLKWCKVDLKDKRLHRVLVRNIVLFATDGQCQDKYVELEKARLCDSLFGTATAFPVFAVLIAEDPRAVERSKEQLNLISNNGVIEIYDLKDFDSAVTRLNLGIAAAMDQDEPVRFVNHSHKTKNPQAFYVDAQNGSSIMVPPGVEVTVMQNKNLPAMATVRKVPMSLTDAAFRWAVVRRWRCIIQSQLRIDGAIIPNEPIDPKAQPSLLSAMGTAFFNKASTVPSFGVASMPVVVTTSEPSPAPVEQKVQVEALDENGKELVNQVAGHVLLLLSGPKADEYKNGVPLATIDSDKFSDKAKEALASKKDIRMNYRRKTVSVVSKFTPVGKSVVPFFLKNQAAVAVILIPLKLEIVIDADKDVFMTRSKS